MTTVRADYECCNSATRGIFGGGYTGQFSTPTDIIDYVTMASTGNATDFGDLSASRSQVASTSSPTRGIFAGGENGGKTNTIEYITIASTGDVTDFGDLTATTVRATGSSNGTRGIIAGGAKNNSILT